jgi:hypothetical protein
MAEKQIGANKNSRAGARVKPPKKERLRGRPWWLPFAGFLLATAILVALTVAVLVTVFLVIKISRPDLAARVPTLGVDLNDNLTVGITFFWLELFALAALIKSYEWAIDGLSARARFYDLYAQLKMTVEEIWDAQHEFASSLDESKTVDGDYAAGYWGLNIAIGKIREKFTDAVLRDVKMTDHGRLVVDRTLHGLDNMLRDTYDLAKRAERLVDRATERLKSTEPEAGPVSGEPETAADVAASPESTGLSRDERKELEALLEEMFEMTDPNQRGLTRLKRSMMAAAGSLGFKRLDDEFEPAASRG